MSSTSSRGAAGCPRRRCTCPSPSSDPRPPPKGRLQNRKLERAIVAHSVDVERRRPVHPTAHPAHEILADPAGVGMLDEFPVELAGIQAESFGISVEVGSIKPLLVLEQYVVHCPEPPLSIRRLCCLSCLLGVGMHGSEREV